MPTLQKYNKLIANFVRSHEKGIECHKGIVATTLRKRVLELGLNIHIRVVTRNSKVFMINESIVDMEIKVENL